VIQQATRHVEAGLVNTDLHGTPPMDDQERQKLLAKERSNSATAARRSHALPKSQSP